MNAVLGVVRKRVADSLAPLSSSEQDALLSAAEHLRLEEQDRLAMEILGLALRARRRYGHRVAPLVDQLVTISDRLLGAVEAA